MREQMSVQGFGKHGAVRTGCVKRSVIGASRVRNVNEDETLGHVKDRVESEAEEEKGNAYR